MQFIKRAILVIQSVISANLNRTPLNHHVSMRFYTRRYVICPPIGIGLNFQIGIDFFHFFRYFVHVKNERTEFTVFFVGFFTLFALTKQQIIVLENGFLQGKDIGVHQFQLFI